MLYCNVEDGVILTVPRPLPGGVNPSSAEAAGWIPAVFLNMPHQIDHNPITQKLEMQQALVEGRVECWFDVEEKEADVVEATRQLVMAHLRDERDRRLLQSDWTQLPTAPLPTTEKVLWESYRQQLRTFVDSADLVNPEWPVAPAAPSNPKAVAVAAVNRAAGVSRERYITSIPGQEATYLWKEQEAHAWTAATDPVDTDYLILNAEAQACGLSVADVATLVLTTAAQFRVLAAQIEGLRRGAIVAIEAATTEAEINAALMIIWP